MKQVICGTCHQVWGVSDLMNEPTYECPKCSAKREVKSKGQEIQKRLIRLGLLRNPA